ncbi:hypothetical protein GCM10010211_00370 [Streptomyces albospinus]|uniref:Lipoprotein n=1 Tax=Streptomyces albospinus TaxID=285515 RepID=A0ABQ2UJQ3_9ACTN|nr:hypothetical protein [Streptomyces albospinus]GGU41340.1 hypothetical protein GCM10010211_00370 [Streptomyces albospinus]
MKAARPALAMTIAAALLAASIWTWVAAPCGLCTPLKAGDAPARCINE